MVLSLLLYNQWLETIATVVDGSTGNSVKSARTRLYRSLFLACCFHLVQTCENFCCVIKSVTYKSL